MLGLLTLALLFEHAAGHSWVECSVYDPLSFDHTTLGDFDRSRCSGYPRGFKRQFDAGFGVDTGYNWGHPDCARDPFRESDYDDQVKMAKLASGQTFYVSHPSKNHVADTCTNAFIPSTELKVMMSSQSGADTFDVKLEMVGPDHVNGVIDHLGYQRCFNFCGNLDKAHCLTGWKLPDNIPEGRYSFIWIWQFNVMEYYSNCFDVYVSANGETQSTPATTPVATIVMASGSGSGSNATIVEPPTTPEPSMTLSSTFPTPAVTVPVSSPSSTPQSSTVVPVGSSTSSPSPTSPVVTSDSNNISSPLALVKSYLMNITGSFNVSGLLNLTMSAMNDAFSS